MSRVRDYETIASKTTIHNIPPSCCKHGKASSNKLSAIPIKKCRHSKQTTAWPRHRRQAHLNKQADKDGAKKKNSNRTTTSTQPTQARTAVLPQLVPASSYAEPPYRRRCTTTSPTAYQQAQPRNRDTAADAPQHHRDAYQPKLKHGTAIVNWMTT